MNKRRNFIAIFIAGVLLLPLVVIVLMQCRQLYVQHKAKERMEIQALHTLQIEPKDFRWVKAEKEILVDGKMFDVHSYEAYKNHVIVRGLFDEEETAINNFLSMQNSGDGWLVQLLYFTGLVCVNQLFLHFSFGASACTATQIFRTITNCITRAKEIITPPPQFACA
ncbi:MAG: hypothetical protein V4676_11070 [Bacteroidota bacterium]